ncbi:hypothetical protein [Phycicoccus sp. DTK01]|uniref:DUF6642 family protein n=1 Tax=Phycicoccus sp. DTK01 TaxID=2785745 RepID=UPI001A8DBFB8|nr:hypothetical protein [Phycicoccus sp. DTK01]GIL33991.1 hypothetical protein PDTK01_00680 [Phycicoccus sp. DTK01]
MPTKPHIWVMEGRWSSSVKDVRSVQPVLTALQDAAVTKSAVNHLNTVEDLHVAMRRWSQKQHASYSVGYLALHGEPGKVYVGRRSVDVASLADHVPPRGLTGKILHFGSCAVLDLDERECDDMRKALGVRALMGFTEDVDWFDSLAFELMLFRSLARYHRLDVVERDVQERAGSLGNRLGFRIIRRRS